MEQLGLKGSYVQSFVPSLMRTWPLRDDIELERQQGDVLFQFNGGLPAISRKTAWATLWD